IEEGMLSVLKFKRSLFAGVLDGGEKDVFLGGSRLNKFMESVEKATAAIPPQELLDDAEEALRRPPMEGDDEEPQPQGRRRGGPAGGGMPAAAAGGMPGVAAGDPWSVLLQVGMALLQQLAGAEGGTGGGSRSGGSSAEVVRDERTGEAYLKVPLPQPEVLEN